MWGPKMRKPQDEAGEFEQTILDGCGLSLSDFGRIGSLAAGTRRALHAAVTDIGAVADPNGIVVSFTLPAGSFATVLLNELQGPLPTQEDQTPVDELRSSAAADGGPCA